MPAALSSARRASIAGPADWSRTISSTGTPAAARAGRSTQRWFSAPLNGGLAGVSLRLIRWATSRAMLSRAELFDRARHRLAEVERRAARFRAAGQAEAQILVARQAREGLAQHIHAAERPEQAAPTVLDDLRVAAPVGGDAREPGR